MAVIFFFNRAGSEDLGLLSSVTVSMRRYLSQTTQMLCLAMGYRPLWNLHHLRFFVKVVIMSSLSPEKISETLNTLYRDESGRVLATLVRLLGDLDLAEDAMHEAFA